MTQTWFETFGTSQAGGPEFGSLVERLRHLLDAATMTDAEPADMALAIDHLRDATRLLARRVPEGDVFPAGHRMELPARGHPMLIPISFDYMTDETMHGRLRFSAAHMGHPGIAHGGYVALAFDEAFGLFASRLDPPARTVTLNMTYRAGTPANKDLDVEARLVSKDGRKVRVAGLIRYGDTVTAEAEGFFIQPRSHH